MNSCSGEMAKTKGIKTTDYYRYADKVCKGKIRACLFVRQACQRFLADLERKDIEFRKDAVDRGFRFINALRHFAGKSSGQQFLLEPFQSFIVANLLGWYWVKTGDRRFTSAYIEMARKGGKTALIAALSIYFFLGDGEDGAEVDIAANDFEQAKVCFRFIQQYCRQLDPKGKDLRVLRSSVEMEANSSYINVFSSNDKGKDGFNASVGIIDEYHSAPNTRMRDVIKSSMGMRRNPMLLTITSAGFDKTLPCYALRTTCTEILRGLKKDDSMFCMIFTLDEEDDWRDPKVWIKSNPNLGKTVTEKYLREQVNSAINNPGEEMSVRTKNLGQWLSSNEIWIPEHYIMECSKDVSLEDFRDAEAWCGADLAVVDDMTAFTYLLKREDDPLLYFKTIYYLPESALEDSPNKDRYVQWKKGGYLKLTPGNVTDYQWITNDIVESSRDLILRNIFYDRYNAISWVTQCTEIGLPMEEYSQSLGNFNRPTKEFERLCRSRGLVIDNNPITRWMFTNVALKHDHNGNCKPDKGLGRARKIDGVISILEALGGWLMETPADVSLQVV